MQAVLMTTFEELAEKFRRWKKAGIKLDLDSGIGDDYADFYTEDKEVAIREGFVCVYEDGTEWHNLQFAYYGLEEYDKAESCRRKAEQIESERNQIQECKNEKNKQNYI